MKLAGGCGERGTISCTFSFNGKKYDLNKPSVVKSLRCARVPYAPRGGSQQYLLFNSEGPYQFMTPSFSTANDVYEDFSCLPVPTRVGQYQMVLAEKAKPEKVAPTGWNITCTRVTCSSYYDNLTSIDPSLTTKMTVRVTKSDVSLKGILG